MITLLADVNLDGHARLIEMRLATTDWRDFQEHLQIRFVHFKDVGLDREAKDDVVWRLCQAEGYFLLTSNRNRDSEDSLQATISREGTAESLPVFTFANAQEMFRRAAYLDKVLEKLVTYLLDQERYRGAGRLFLP